LRHQPIKNQRHVKMNPDVLKATSKRRFQLSGIIRPSWAQVGMDVRGGMDVRMTSAEFAMALFATCNAERVPAYIPQIVGVVRDCGRAPGISCLTCGSFAVANLSTVGYAPLVVSHWWMAAILVVQGQLLPGVASVHGGTR
jgi:hypothetical protein